MQKSYRKVGGDGGVRLMEKIKEKSQGIVSVVTDDTDISLAHLLQKYGNGDVKIGYCFDGRRNRWRVVKIRAKRIRRVQHLSGVKG